MIRTLAVNLHKAARAVYLPAGKRGRTIPILAAVRLRFVNGEIELSSYDLDKGATITETAPAVWDGETWETCIPMKPLRDWLAVVAKYKEVLTLQFDPSVQVIQFTTDPRVTGTRSKTEFKCLDAREFPA